MVGIREPISLLYLRDYYTFPGSPPPWERRFNLLDHHQRVCDTGNAVNISGKGSYRRVALTCERDCACMTICLHICHRAYSPCATFLPFSVFLCCDIESRITGFVSDLGRTIAEDCSIYIYWGESLGTRLGYYHALLFQPHRFYSRRRHHHKGRWGRNTPDRGTCLGNRGYPGERKCTHVCSAWAIIHVHVCGSPG